MHQKVNIYPGWDKNKIETSKSLYAPYFDHKIISIRAMTKTERRANIRLGMEPIVIETEGKGLVFAFGCGFAEPLPLKKEVKQQ